MQVVAQRVWRGAWRGGSVLAPVYIKTASLNLTTKKRILIPTSLFIRQYCSTLTNPFSAAETHTIDYNDPTIKPEALAALRNAYSHFSKNELQKASDEINKAVSIDNSQAVRERVVKLFFAFKLLRHAVLFADALIAELGDKVTPWLLFFTTFAHYELIQPEKVVELATKYIQWHGGKETLELTAMYTMRGVSLTTLFRQEEALQDFAKLEHLPKIPVTDELLYQKAYDGKWALILCLMQQKEQKEPKETEKICDMAMDILFKDTNLSQCPTDTKLNANRFLIFHNAILTNKSKIPEVVSRLTNEIIDNENANPFWKSLAVVERRELNADSLTAVQSATESYNAIMLHRNPGSLLGIPELSGDIFALIPDINRDKFLMALDEIASYLYANREVPNYGTIMRECFWTNIAFISFTMNDFDRAAIYCQLGLAHARELPEKDKHILNRLAATCYLLKKQFDKAVQYIFMPTVDRLQVLVLATAYVMLGEEHYEKAKGLLLMLHKGEESEKLVHEQMAVLVRDRERILSEEINIQPLAEHWRAFRLVNSNLIPFEEKVKSCEEVLNIPEISKPLFSILRYDIMNRLGGIYLDERNYEKAIEYFEKVEKEYPALARYADMRGCYYQLKKLPEALHVLNKLIKLNDPKEIDQYLIELAIVYIDVGRDYDKAYEVLSQCANKTSRGWLENMADTCKMSGRREEALLYLDKVLELPDSDKIQVHLIRGTVLLEMKRYEEAKKEYEMVAEHPVKGPSANLGLAKIYDEYLNNPTTALQLYAKVVKNFPEDAHEGSAWCLYKLGLYELALEQIELAFEHNKQKKPWLFLLRAHTNAALQNKAKALEDFQEVISMNKEYVAEAYFSRGKVQYLSQDKEAATADFEAAIKLDPEMQERIQNFYSLIEMNTK